MLVYLDHSHLVLLAEAASAGTPQFTSFIEFWHDNALTLALSRVHLIEMRRHADPDVREQRYRLLEHFVPFHSDIGPRSEYPQSLLESEISAAFARKVLVLQGKTKGTAVANPFPESFDTTESLQALREFEAPAFDQFLQFFQAGVETSVEAQARPQGIPYTPTRASQLPREPLSKAEADKALEQLEATFASDALLSEIYGGTDADVVRSVVEPLLERIRNFIRRAQIVGPALAYAEFIGVDLETLGNKRMDRTVHESVFRHEVRRVATALFKRVSPGLIESMVASVSIADCPGHWLSRELDLEIRAAEAEQDSSNAYDVDHAGYLPYVDIFLADKRIAGYIKRILQRTAGPISLVPGRGPHATARSVAALQSALEAALKERAV